MTLHPASLISIKILCDAGCKVTYADDECRVYYTKKIVWLGKREPQTGLWILPLTDTTRQSETNTPAENYKRMDVTHKEYAHNAYAMTSKASLVQYLHQAAFSPPKATLLKALHNNQFVTWPGLTVKSVKNIYARLLTSNG